jgi:plasmid maintenance system antidote protein VapI
MHPVHTAKHVARALNCTPKTAENILAGHLSARSITRLTMAYGLGFLIDVGAAVTGTTLRDHIIEQANQARREQLMAEAREREFIELEQGLSSRRAERSGHDRRLS